MRAARTKKNPRGRPGGVALELDEKPAKGAHFTQAHSDFEACSGFEASRENKMTRWDKSPIGAETPQRTRVFKKEFSNG